MLEETLTENDIPALYILKSSKFQSNRNSHIHCVYTKYNHVVLTLFELTSSALTKSKTKVQEFISVFMQKYRVLCFLLSTFQTS